MLYIESCFDICPEGLVLDLFLVIEYFSYHSYFIIISYNIIKFCFVRATLEVQWTRECRVEDRSL